MKKQTIMCVDDEQVVLRSLKDQLKRHLSNEFIIETVESGEEALEIVEELLEEGEELPLIISDQIMPGMKGNELLRQIQEKSKKTLKILLTGQASAEDVGDAINSSKLYRYISKPWEQEDLNMTVSEALRSYQQDRKLEESNQLLKEYNEKLEEKVKERTLEIEEQKNVIHDKNMEITDSINYAKYIQEAMLPTRNEVQTSLPESFIFFRPRDIVSGDFYWHAEKEDKIIFAAADCTGHGIPGALVSMIGMGILQQVVLQNGVTEADLILNKLHKGVQRSLKQTDGVTSVADGMDIALVVIDKEREVLQFAGAHNPLVYIENGEVHKLRGDRMAIGGSQEEKERKFQRHEIPLKKGVWYYLYSDGYQDQFGGERGKKFKVKAFHNALLELHKRPAAVQEEELYKTIIDWMGKEHQQIDDILVVGFTI